jgi:hypothetical protein
VFLTVNFFTPKFMIIRWYFFFLGSFARSLENRLSTCHTYLNFRLVSMSDVEYFYLKGVLTQYFNSVEVVNFIKKVTLKMISCKTMRKKKK